MQFQLMNMYLWDFNIPITVIAAPYIDPKVRLNQTVFAMYVGIVFKFCNFGVNGNVTTKLYLYNYIIFITKYWERQKTLCPPCRKVGETYPSRPPWNSVPDAYYDEKLLSLAYRHCKLILNQGRWSGSRCTILEKYIPAAIFAGQRERESRHKQGLLSKPG